MSSDNDSTSAEAASGAGAQPAWSASGVRAERTVGAGAGQRRTPPRPRRQVLVAAAGALVLVAVVAALSGGLPGRVRGSSGGLSAQSLLGDAAAVVLALTLAALCFLVYDAWASRGRRRRPRRPRLRRLSFDPELLLPVVVLGATVALVLALAAILGGSAHPLRLPGRRAAGATTGAPIAHGVRAAGGGIPVDGLAFAIVAALVLVAGATLALRARRRRAPEARTDSADAIAAAVTSSLEDLSAEPDPRRAVIRAYDRMERAFAASGIGRHRAETPLEYLRRALRAVAASQQSVRRLTDLFEQARFSSHTIDAAMKHEAIDALTALRSELDSAERTPA